MLFFANTIGGIGKKIHRLAYKLFYIGVLNKIFFRGLQELFLPFLRFTEQKYEFSPVQALQGIIGFGRGFFLK